jgi:MFS family permease
VQSDTPLLFATRILRLFAYGFLSIVLALYLEALGFGEAQIGLLLTLTLAGDAVLSLAVTTSADRLGRRRMLVLGAGMMALAGGAFAFTRSPWLLMLAATIGVISPSGNEIGPFLSIEQAALAQVVPEGRRTRVFAWYNLVGSFATAAGALVGGYLASTLEGFGRTPLQAYRVVVLGYALCGFLLGVLFLTLSPRIEATPILGAPDGSRVLGLHRSRRTVTKLAGLFALDAFAGGLVVQSLLAYWFHIRFGADAGMLGHIFFGANLLAGVSALLADRLAARFGLVNTMVFTHIPSNLLLCLVPLMPNLPLAVGVLLLRFSISQMDVPTRQSYVVAIVAPDERSAAAGVTGIARSVGASLSPVLCGSILSRPALLGLPFFLAGGLKIVYDLLLYRGFKRLVPPEESRPAPVARQDDPQSAGDGPRSGDR